jgi:hypothetical protein
VISARFAALTSRLTSLLASLLAFTSLLGGCASTNANISNLGDGVFEIRCKGTTLVNCLQQVERVCKGSEYDVLRAQDQRKRFGGDSSSVVEERASIAKVRCAATGRPLLDFYKDDEPEEPIRPWKLERRSPEVERPPLAPVVTAPPAAAPSTADAPKGACVPGSTQACVGPGACNGGQSCLADGSGYAPCDCGGGSKPAGP